MDEHNRWLKKGFEQQVFIFAGTIQPGIGGCILAQGETSDEINNRISQDPFVQKNVVKAEIMEVDGKKADQRLQFLLN